METKVILFDGGPLHNQFREVPKDQNVFEIFTRVDTLVSSKGTKMLDTVEMKRTYYKGTSTYYKGVQSFVYIELKPTDNESDNKDVEVTKV